MGWEKTRSFLPLKDYEYGRAKRQKAYHCSEQLLLFNFFLDFQSHINKKKSGPPHNTENHEHRRPEYPGKNQRGKEDENSLKRGTLEPLPRVYSGGINILRLIDLERFG
jgi:hypothetical protein